MGARRLKLVASVGSERSVTLAAVVADLRRLSPEALTRCSRLIQALAHAESVVRRVQADRMRLAEGDDLAADPAARGTDDGRIRVGHHHGVLASQPDACAAVPGELHGLILTQPAG